MNFARSINAQSTVWKMKKEKRKKSNDSIHLRGSNRGSADPQGGVPSPCAISSPRPPLWPGRALHRIRTAHDVGKKEFSFGLTYAACMLTLCWLTESWDLLFILPFLINSWPTSHRLQKKLHEHSNDIHRTYHYYPWPGGWGRGDAHTYLYKGHPILYSYYEIITPSHLLHGYEYKMTLINVGMCLILQDDDFTHTGMSILLY